MDKNILFSIYSIFIIDSFEEQYKIFLVSIFFDNQGKSK